MTLPGAWDEALDQVSDRLSQQDGRNLDELRD